MVERKKKRTKNESSTGTKNRYHRHVPERYGKNENCIHTSYVPKSSPHQNITCTCQGFTPKGLDGKKKKV